MHNVIMASGGETRKATGRRKVEMKLIEKEENLLVCFSKRRVGLFKKANELSVLCGVYVAVIVFSPSGKPYSFGHPSVDAVTDRLARGGAGSAWREVDAAAAVLGHGREVMRLRGVVREQKQKKAELENSIKAVLGVGGVSLFDGRLEELAAADLVCLRAGLEKLQADVSRRLHELVTSGELPAADMATNDSATTVAAAATAAGGSEELSPGAFEHGPIMPPPAGYDYGQGLDLGEGFDNILDFDQSMMSEELPAVDIATNDSATTVVAAASAAATAGGGIEEFSLGAFEHAMMDGPIMPPPASYDYGQGLDLGDVFDYVLDFDQSVMTEELPAADMATNDPDTTVVSAAAATAAGGIEESNPGAFQHVMMDGPIMPPPAGYDYGQGLDFGEGYDYLLHFDQSVLWEELPAADMATNDSATTVASAAAATTTAAGGIQELSPGTFEHNGPIMPPPAGYDIDYGQGLDLEEGFLEALYSDQDFWLQLRSN